MNAHRQGLESRTTTIRGPCCGCRSHSLVVVTLWTVGRVARKSAGYMHGRTHLRYVCSSTGCLFPPTLPAHVCPWAHNIDWQEVEAQQLFAHT